MAVMLRALLDRAHVADPAHSTRLFEEYDSAEPDLAIRAALTAHVARDPAASRWAQRVRASSAQLARATADAAVDTVTAVLAPGQDLPADILHQLDTALSATRKSPAITHPTDVRALHAVVRGRRRRADIASILADTDVTGDDPAPLAADLASDSTFRTRVLCAIGDRLMLDHEPLENWVVAAADGRLGALDTDAEPDPRAAWAATVLTQSRLRWTSGGPDTDSADILARVASSLNPALKCRMASRIRAGGTADEMPDVAARRSASERGRRMDQ
ncbi:hypothetical protein AMAG_15094 [Allomyces macrogynus ATCC 38327]|uniref:Uncharacterized protein n=1 Tax=Allomyces macrogynus (strain ATCC 38327) TaxID=578462 RepID=A0A0L0T6E9_ALLM3|nr:hypothetical protein AMAG_15094 [Allomyces macrogynus ATCC 38327]|eukprot:KNE70119.1 hypothetical protein AMAG_15094 [Allomyces macrogynus ATCC 38327]